MTISWTQNMIGCEASSHIGTFFISPAREKSKAGVTMFSLTLLAPAGERGHRGEIHQTIGTFESPAIARLTAEAMANA